MSINIWCLSEEQLLIRVFVIGNTQMYIHTSKKLFIVSAEELSCGPVDNVKLTANCWCGHSPRTRHPVMWVKWSLGSITTNKASGHNGIIAELFEILKDDAVKMLHSICQQIWKTQQWPQNWKRSVFIPIPRKSNAKECSNYWTIALISHASKVMFKSLQARLQQYLIWECPDVQACIRKGRGTRDQIANIR